MATWGLQWSIRPSKLIDDKERELSEVLMWAGGTLSNRVIRATPRRTGRLAYGWNYSPSQPDRSVPGPGNYGIKTVPQHFGGRPSMVFLYNGVPYVVAQNDGYTTNSGRSVAGRHFFDAQLPTFQGLVDVAARRFFT